MHARNSQHKTTHTIIIVFYSFLYTKIIVIKKFWRRYKKTSNDTDEITTFAISNTNFMKLIAPSLLSADFSRLADDVRMLDQSHADWVHLDIMDGVFVPNISFGLPVVSAIRPLTKKPFDVHLMIVEPERYFEAFKKAGADWISFHLEASTHVHRAVQQLKALEVKAGIVLNPHTPVSLLEDIISDLDYVLLMSVNPGFGGQSFIENTYKKIKTLRQMIDTTNSKCLIQVDGGVNINNANALFTAGADVLVAGSAVFSATDPAKMITDLKQ